MMSGSSIPEQQRKMFIGGLSRETTEDGLTAFYSQFGEIVDLFISRDAHSKMSRGFGFVTFANPQSVDDSLNALPHVIDGKTVDPKRAMPKEQIDRGGSGPRTKKTFVGGLAPGVGEEEIKNVFSSYGPVEEVELIRERETGKPRGFGFVTFCDFETVERVCALHYVDVCGKKVEVKKAESRQTMQSGGFRGGFGGGGGGFRGGRGGGYGGGFGEKGGFRGRGRGGFMGRGRGGGYGGGYNNSYGGDGGYGGGFRGGRGGGSGYGGGYGGAQAGGRGGEFAGGYGGGQPGGYNSGAAGGAGGYGAGNTGYPGAYGGGQQQGPYQQSQGYGGPGGQQAYAGSAQSYGNGGAAAPGAYGGAGNPQGGAYGANSSYPTPAGQPYNAAGATGAAPAPAQSYGAAPSAGYAAQQSAPAAAAPANSYQAAPAVAGYGGADASAAGAAGNAAGYTAGYGAGYQQQPANYTPARTTGYGGTHGYAPY